MPEEMPLLDAASRLDRIKGNQLRRLKGSVANAELYGRTGVGGVDVRGVLIAVHVVVDQIGLAIVMTSARCRFEMVG